MTHKLSTTRTAKAVELLEGQNRILRMVATDVPLSDILTHINQFIEFHAPRVLCSTLILNETGTALHEAIAPSLPPEYLKELGAVAVGPKHGSCGTAAYRRQPVFVADIAANPLWENVRAIALKYQLRACSSWPIIGRGGSVLGTFAVYYREVTLPDENEQELIALSTDLTRVAIESVQSNARTQWLVHHDELTRLQNRLAFTEQLKHSLQISEPDFALLVIDLDRFKVINDTLGHDIGDHLLKEVAKRLSASINAVDIIARAGGDEFFILAHREDYSHVCEQILKTLRAPFFTVGGYELHVTASIGVAVADQATAGARALIREADIALYMAKRSGRNTYAFYHAEETDHNSVERLRLEVDLRHAVENSSIEVFYQPQLDVHNQTIIGVEALARWRHPKLGFLKPNSFIPLAEETGAIVPIGFNVLDIACQQMQEWQHRHGHQIRVSVNLSARQLLCSDLVRRVGDTLYATGLNGSMLELELTESMLIDPSGDALRTLNGLRNLGVTLAIDDFGTGYSSLAYLKRLPIDVLKIDRSFIQDVPGDTESCAIARATIALGHSLGMRVVAEGVETKQQLEFLRNEQCDTFQGFYISPGVPSDECLALIDSQRQPETIRA